MIKTGVFHGIEPVSSLFANEPDWWEWRVLSEQSQDYRIDFDAEAGCLYVYFPYSERMVKRIKELKGRRWNDTEKRWEITPQNSTLEAIVSFARHHGFRVADSFVKRHTKPEEYEAEKNQ